MKKIATLAALLSLVAPAFAQVAPPNVIGVNPQGIVVLVNRGGDASNMPTTFNGVAVTVYSLTAAQQAAYLTTAASACCGMTFDGNTFTALPAPPPTPAQVYAKAIAAGLTITSTSTPTLDGTYAIDPATQANITAEQVYIATKGTFTNGQATKPWPDKSGAFHVFPSATEFTAFAVAVAQYVYALQTALATAQHGGTPTWPSASAAIP